MKSAKEWAAEVVRQSDSSRGWRRYAAIEDDAGGVYLMSQSDYVESPAMTAAHGSAIIERLVERVQADARAPLEEEIARLRDQNDKMRAAVLAARDVCLVHDWDMMSSDGDYERVLVDLIKATGLEYK